jgi:hypothetical protein
MSPGKAVAKVAAKVAGNAVKKAATKKATKQSAKRVEIMRKAEKKAESAKAERTFAKKPSSSVKVVKPQGKASAKFRNEKEAERIARTARTKTSSFKDLRGRAKQDYEVSKIKVSDNVTARVPAKSNYEFAKDMSTFGKIQKQNAGPLKTTKAEAKANARGLKAANKRRRPSNARNEDNLRQDNGSKESKAKRQQNFNNCSSCKSAFNSTAREAIAT